MFDPLNTSLLVPIYQKDNDIPVYFFDRSSDLFAPILDFYRTGVVRLPPGISKSALLQELDYFGIDVGIVAENDFGSLPISGSASYSMSVNEASTLKIESIARRFIPVIIECLRAKLTCITLKIDLQGRLSSADLSKIPRVKPVKELRPSSLSNWQANASRQRTNLRRHSATQIETRQYATSPPSSLSKEPIPETTQVVTLTSLCRRDILFWEDFVRCFHTGYRDNFDGFVGEFINDLENEWLKSIHFADATEWAAEDGLASKVRFSGGSGFKDSTGHQAPLEMLVSAVSSSDEDGLPLVANPASANSLTRGSSGELDGVMPPQSVFGLHRIGFLHFHSGWEITIWLRTPFAKSRDESGIY
ncbi:hypothetical protein HK096_002655, partial [Nowakowskiella sp. JEL0078]